MTYDERYTTLDKTRSSASSPVIVFFLIAFPDRDLISISFDLGFKVHNVTHDYGLKKGGPRSMYDTILWSKVPVHAVRLYG